MSVLHLKHTDLRPLLLLPDEQRWPRDLVWADLAVQQGCALSSAPERGDTGDPAEEAHHPGAILSAQLHGQGWRGPVRAQPVGPIGPNQGEKETMMCGWRHLCFRFILNSASPLQVLETVVNGIENMGGTWVQIHVFFSIA